MSTGLDNRKCCLCFEPLEGKDAYELPRYKPHIPRELCPECRDRFFQTVAIANRFVHRELEECREEGE